MEEKFEDNLLVSDAMDQNPITMGLDTKLDDALHQMLQKHTDSLIAVDKSGQVKGSLDLRALLIAQNEGKKHKTLGELVTQQAFSVSSQTPLHLALVAMNKRQVHAVPVIDNQQLRGELRLTTVGQRMPELFARKNKELSDLRADIDRKDDYLGLVSHDMRTPLTVIALSIDFLLAEDCRKTMSADQQSFVERIKRNGEVATGMIHDILDVVRLDHGFQLDYQKVIFSALIHDCIENLNVIAARKGIQIKVNVDQDVQISLDPKRINQVIENLVMNALKFSPENGLVLVRSWLEQRLEGSFLAFEVKDQGMGIRKEDEVKIFEAFVQAGKAKAGSNGVGLGLAIVRKFVEFHQGFIELDGGWQKGASIRVFVPGAVAANNATPLTPGISGPVILLVEDDESIREFYKISLAAYKYHVIEAGDGADGFKLFQQNKVDAILSDIRMPKMDGIELLTKVRMTGRDVPVILCSGYYVGLENELARSAHKPDRIIDKPFKVKDMVDAIEEQLRRYKQAS